MTPSWLVGFLERHTPHKAPSDRSVPGRQPCPPLRLAFSTRAPVAVAVERADHVSRREAGIELIQPDDITLQDVAHGERRSSRDPDDRREL